MTGAARHWDGYWYGPVAAVRPYLWIQGFLVLLALDVWRLRIGRAGLYGAYDFNVAHFQWLDTVQPVPTPGLYAGVLVLCGLLSLILAFTGVHRLGLTALFVLYTYSWAMSMRDLFQHHYLVSLFLLCAVCFPRIGAADLEAHPAPRTSAFGYALLRTTAAVVYVFTAVAKLDPEWHSGATLRSIEGTEALLEPLVTALAALGLSEPAAWSLVANGVIAVEATIAFGLLLAVRRDTATGRLARLGFPVVGLLALALHLGFEALDLQIGWFSSYMALLVCVVFLPERWLLAVATAASGPRRSVAARVASWRIGASRFARSVWSIALAAVVGVGTLLVGRLVDVPGAFEACALAALVLVAATVAANVRAPGSSTLGPIVATALAPCVMWTTIATSTARYELYSERFDYLLASGDHDGATAAFTKTARHAPHRNAHVEARLGHMLESLGRPAAAIEHYRHALVLAPDEPVPYNNLAWLHATHPDPTIRDAAEAIRLGERASALTGGREATVLDTLAAAYAAAGRYELAAATARAALRAASDAGEAELAGQIDQRLQRYGRGMAWTNGSADITAE